MENVNVSEKNDEIKIIPIKSNQSIAESNLMLLPFISVQNTSIKILKRTWVSNGMERGLEVKGSVDLGVPTVKELDTMLALFRIMIKNMNFHYEYNTVTNKVNFSNSEIHFTFKELAEEMGYSKFSGQIKSMLERSLKILNESTIYSRLSGSLRDAEKGEYITDFNGEESFRLIYDLKIYSYKDKKKKGEKIGNAEEVRSKTSLKIHDFFFKNLCNNYLKIYDYTQYLKLKYGISKKLFLLLNQWSHGYEKLLTYQVMYDMLGLEVKTKKDMYYYNKQIKAAFKELIDVNFIDDFSEDKKKNAIRIIFNSRLTSDAKFLHKYVKDDEVIDRLREIGVTFDDILKYYRLDNQDYVRGLLRYFDFKLKNKEIVNYETDGGLGFLMAGLSRENYNLEGFM